ncbi:MAG: Rv3654c family TadE-like protein, partial [Actinomycetota bacterium]
MLSLRRADHGNASVVVVGGMATVMVFLLGLSDLAVFFIARTRAQTAADSASLAAAAELIPGIGEDPEGKAREYAGANGAKLVACDCAPGGTVAQVSVTVPVNMTLSAFSNVKEV